MIPLPRLDSALGLVVCAGLCGWTAGAAPWPAWRGPEGSGIAHETGVPWHWSTKHNVR